jgi:hypothetical protein
VDVERRWFASADDRERHGGLRASELLVSRVEKVSGHLRVSDHIRRFVANEPVGRPVGSRRDSHGVREDNRPAGESSEKIRSDVAGARCEPVARAGKRVVASSRTEEGMVLVGSVATGVGLWPGGPACKAADTASSSNSAAVPTTIARVRKVMIVGVSVGLGRRVVG